MSGFESEYDKWPPNCFLTGDGVHKVVPSQPWVPSPEIPLFPLPNEPPAEQLASPPVVPKVKAWQAYPHFRKPKGTHHKDDLLKRRGSRLSLRYWRDWLADKRSRRKDGGGVQETLSSLRSGPRPTVTPADFRAFGHWARPTINNVRVHNATPPPERRSLPPAGVEALFGCLEGGGRAHPENWISRVEHPSLPPRPSFWPSPPLRPVSLPIPDPPASELQLNPLLEYRIVGRPAVYYNIRWAEDGAFVSPSPPLQEPNSNGEPVYRAFDIDGPNGLQPATYPGVSYLQITALANDMFPKFPWPITVLSHHGSLPVTIKDVLGALHQNFQEYMTKEEVCALEPIRRDLLYRSYYGRIETMFVREHDSGLKRVDYLGDCFMFRGLTPAPSGKGFILHTGPP